MSSIHVAVIGYMISELWSFCLEYVCEVLRDVKCKGSSNVYLISSNCKLRKDNVVTAAKFHRLFLGRISIFILLL